MSPLTADRLRSILDYDPLTGIFTRRVPAGKWGQIPVGTIAGTIRKDGYVQIWVDGRLYLGNRLAFLWVLGRWPDPEADHEDCDPSNNRWVNLREATRGARRLRGGRSDRASRIFENPLTAIFVPTRPAETQRDKLDKDYLSRKEAALYLTKLGCAISAQTLANMGANNNAMKGPPFFRFRWNRVCYSKADLDVWAKREMVRVG